MYGPDLTDEQIDQIANLGIGDYLPVEELGGSAWRVVDARDERVYFEDSHGDVLTVDARTGSHHVSTAY